MRSVALERPWALTKPDLITDRHTSEVTFNNHSCSWATLHDVKHNLEFVLSVTWKPSTLASPQIQISSPNWQHVGIREYHWTDQGWGTKNALVYNHEINKLSTRTRIKTVNLLILIRSFCNDPSEINWRDIINAALRIPTSRYRVSRYSKHAKQS